MSGTLLLIPVISAFIGWVITRLAIKLFFRPGRPGKILGVSFKGIFHGKQAQLAVNLAKLVSTELFSFDEIEQKISDPENVRKILPFLETHIELFLREKLTAEIPMLGMLIGDKTIAQVKGVFIKELQTLFPLLMKQYMSTLASEVDLEKIIVEKIEKISSKKVESILYETMSAEFRNVEIGGAILGFTIGLLQIFLTIAITWLLYLMKNPR